MSLFDDEGDADDIFSASTKPKKKSKKPSFEQLLDDDTDLFVQNKVQQNTSQAEEEEEEEEVTEKVEESSDALFGGGSKTTQELEDEQLFSAGTNATSDREKKPSLFDDEEKEEEEAEKKEEGDAESQESQDSAEGGFSYSWNPNEDNSAVDDGEIAQTEDIQPPAQEESSTEQDQEETDGLYKEELTYEERNRLRRENREKKKASQENSGMEANAKSNADPPPDSTAQIWELSKNLQRVQAEKGALESDNRQLQDEVAELRAKLAVVQETVQKMDQQLKRNDEKLKRNEEELKKKDAEIAELKAKPPAPASPSKTGEQSHPPFPVKKTYKPSNRPNSAESASPRTRVRSGVDKGSTVSSVADSVKKFTGTTSSEQKLGTKPKPATKKPTLKQAASPALEQKATPAKTSPELAKSSTTKPRGDSTSFPKKAEVEKEVVMEAEKAEQNKEESTDYKETPHNAHNVISLFEQKATLPQVDTPPWKRHLKNREKEKEEPTPASSKPTKTIAPPTTNTATAPQHSLPERTKAEPVNGLDEDNSAEPSEDFVSELPPSRTSLSPSRSTSTLPSNTATVTLREKGLKTVTSGSAISEEHKMSSAGDKRASWLPKRQECAVCNRVVYAMEKLEADKVVYHKTCFKCSVCNKTLSTGTYAALQGKIYCKVHFKQLFKMKGNYDEGFGREQHKSKWVKKEDEEVA